MSTLSTVHMLERASTPGAIDNASVLRRRAALTQIDAAPGD